MLASGQTFKEVDVLGYDASGDSSHLAVDYSFGLTAAKTLSVDASGITQLDLEYGSGLRSTTSIRTGRFLVDPG